jgi:hypothetical protein
MRITDAQLMKLEIVDGVIAIESDFEDIAYVEDKKNLAMWIVNTKTGQQIEISAENVCVFAYEMMDVADLHLRENKLFKTG